MDDLNTDTGSDESARTSETPGDSIPDPYASVSPPETAFNWIIPAKNPSALTGYYVSVFSLIPCLALLLGPIAVYFGIKGLRAIQATPLIRGKAHCWIAIIIGGVSCLANALAIVALILSAQFKP